MARIPRYQCQSLAGRSLRPGTGASMPESNRSIIRASILTVKEADSRLIEDFSIGPGLKGPPATTRFGGDNGGGSQ